jgi:hypothetical protein
MLFVTKTYNFSVSDHRSAPPRRCGGSVRFL